MSNIFEDHPTPINAAQPARLSSAVQFLTELFGADETARGPVFLCALRNDGTGEAGHLITRDLDMRPRRLARASPRL